MCWCEEFGISSYKIAARQWENNELMEAVYATGKPVIQSIDPFVFSGHQRQAGVVSNLQQVLPSCIQ